MRKALTGAPCAGKAQARFGGRGGRESFSAPIELISASRRVENEKRAGNSRPLLVRSDHLSGQHERGFFAYLDRGVFDGDDFKVNLVSPFFARIGRHPDDGHVGLQ